MLRLTRLFPSGSAGGRFARDLARFAGRRTVPAAMLMGLGALLEGAGLAFLVPLVGLLTDQRGGAIRSAAQGVFAGFGAETQSAKLAVLLMAFVPILILRAIVQMLRDRALARLQLDFVTMLRLRLADALGAARWQNLVGLRHARVTHSLGTNILQTAGATQLAVQSIVALVTLAALWLLALFLAPPIAGVALALLAINAAALRPLMARAVAVGHGVTNANLSIMNTTTQLLGGLKQAIAQNMRHAFTAEFAADARYVAQLQLAYQWRQSRFRIIVSTGIALAGAGLAMLGLWFDIPIASLLATLVVLMRMAGPVATLQQNAQHLAGMLPAYAALTELLDDIERRPDRSRAAASTRAPFTGAIRFDHVGYAHPDGSGAGLHDISVSIEPGQIVGVVGASGAGKTTFVDLLAGLIEPDAGSIAIGNTPLGPHNAEQWRAGIGYVTQDPHLFNDSIRRNLTGGGEDADEDRLWEALERVGADRLVRTLPQGLDTIVAERGALLSGGERQRLALARALIRRPALLILDEATNAIDLKSEEAALAAMMRTSPRPTIVIVAHRSETLRHCDRVLRFDRGRLVGDGTHLPAAG